MVAGEDEDQSHAFGSNSQTEDLRHNNRCKPRLTAGCQSRRLQCSVLRQLQPRWGTEACCRPHVKRRVLVEHAPSCCIHYTCDFQRRLTSLQCVSCITSSMSVGVWMIAILAPSSSSNQAVMDVPQRTFEKAAAEVASCGPPKRSAWVVDALQCLLNDPNVHLQHRQSISCMHL
jgi:hypothetical protein